MIGIVPFGVDSLYLFNSCPVQASKHCVEVFSANYGATGWVGVTYTQYYVNTYYQFAEGTVQITLNDYSGYTNPRRAVACHELGHALGLGHNVNPGTSCIGNPATFNFPGNDDYQMLASVYSITR